MPRYIDADKVLNNLPNDLPYKASIKRVLIQVPTVDVVEVRHGYWEYSRIGDRIYCGCSECKEAPDCFEPRYCPNCGSKMDRKGSYNG